MLLNKMNALPKLLLLSLSLALFTNCASLPPSKEPSIELRFLDEYIIPEDASLADTKIGGLSGIVKKENEYYMVCDDPSNPRIYKARLHTSKRKIDSLLFNEVILLDKSEASLKNTYLDLEDFIITPHENDFIVVSEGSIKNGKNPSILQYNPQGKLVKKYEIPFQFKAHSESKPRNNGVFEGVTASTDQKGFWVANELPLEADGPKPKLYGTKSPVRFTYYDFKNTTPQKQFTYPLGRIRKIPFLPFYLNGLTDILAIDKDRFLVLERAFSAGRGRKSHNVHIYEYVVYESENTLEKKSVRGLSKPKTEKNLVLDLEDIRKFLTDKTIDNLEGFCYGPTLKNGNKTLLLISDNNFSSFMPQLNQLLWFEIINN
ncbi:esterase-like activity of phytase family protein [Mesonia sp. MT50]|uniref:Esterase-like activity of phytase family protein n=1 Tax=Mesonia profundi TaxID=3070998 RepID=A0ABU0ZYA5_9FLAO|nr:esterase-like activity of phytase family protein [Mesonia profundi]MDQ7916445.1 esterase-like activity of phytase family protein [Mesonia profundi]